MGKKKRKEVICMRFKLRVIGGQTGLLKPPCRLGPYVQKGRKSRREVLRRILKELE